MVKLKDVACKVCKTIYDDEEKCPKCGAKESTDSYKGKIFVLNKEKSEIAKNLNLDSEGEFAIKTR